MTRLRVDARENRARILDAARALFAEKGLAVGMREIARRADVGPATLYRRFPTKQDLIDMAFAEELQQCRRIVVEGSDDSDPWRGFSSVIHQLTLLNSQNRCFVAAFTAQEPDIEVRSTITRQRQELLPRIADLVRRVQAAGALRPDFTMDDLLLVLQVGRGLFSVRPSEAAARRFAEIVLEGLRAR